MGGREGESGEREIEREGERERERGKERERERSIEMIPLILQLSLHSAAWCQQADLGQV